MSFAADDASPVSSLPASPAQSSTPNDADSSSATSSAGSASDLQEYRAPLNGEAPEPSIDGTSVTGGEGGIRADSADQVSDDDKKVSNTGSLGGALAHGSRPHGVTGAGSTQAATRRAGLLMLASLTFAFSHPPSRQQLALSLKSQANAQFTQSHYRESLDLYTVSLNKNPFDPIVWSNRAAVRLKLEEHGLAIADASE